MSRDEGLATALFAVVIGGAVAFAIATDITAPACKAALKAVNHAKDFDFGCLEFWLNRYQGLIGNLLTAAVAGATLIWVARQLVPANQQAGIAAAVALRTVVAEFSEYSSAIDNLRIEADIERLMHEVASGAGFRGVRWHENHIINAAVDLGVACRRFAEITGKIRSPIALTAAENAQRFLEELQSNADMISEILPVEGDITPEINRDVEILILECRDLITQINDQFERTKARIDLETQSAWITIRDLEHKAIGPWWRRKKN